jgi:uncharacterized membrane protein YtjA (UPF0391 family)
VGGQSPRPIEGSLVMLGWSLLFAILAVICAVLGFWHLVPVFAGIAKILFFIFLILLVISFVIRAFRGRSVV